MPGSQPARFRFHIGGVASLPPGSTFGPRTIRDHEFLWIISGDSEAEWDGQPYPLPAGSLSLIRPGTRDYYRWNRAQTTQALYLHFQIEQMPADFPPPESWPKMRRLPPDNVLRPLLLHLLWLLANRSPPHLGLAQSAMCHLLGTYLSGEYHTALLAASELPQPLERALRFAHEWSATHAGRSPTRAQLARVACLSEGHLARLFRLHFGCGPLSALRLLRLDQAASLLAGSNLAVKEVAAQTGFANAFHFSRTFRDHFGCSPRSYRRKALEGKLVPGNRLKPLRYLPRQIGPQALRPGHEQDRRESPVPSPEYFF